MDRPMSSLGIIISRNILFDCRDDVKQLIKKIYISAKYPIIRLLEGWTCHTTLK